MNWRGVAERLLYLVGFRQRRTTAIDAGRAQAIAHGTDFHRRLLNTFDDPFTGKNASQPGQYPKRRTGELRRNLITYVTGSPSTGYRIHTGIDTAIEQVPGRRSLYTFPETRRLSPADFLATNYGSSVRSTSDYIDPVDEDTSIDGVPVIFVRRG